MLSYNTYAQSPESMNYQAVIRDGSGNVLSTQAVGLQIKILLGSSSGSSVYEETFTPTTNAYGSIAIQIGTGTVVSGTFNTIDWGANSHFVETAVDIDGTANGTSYVVISTTQLMSVPYALHSKSSDAWSTNSNLNFTNNKVSVGNTTSSNQTYPLSVVSVHDGITSRGIDVLRTDNSGNNIGVPMSFSMLNSNNQPFEFGKVLGRTESNTAGSEVGGLSFHVADGTGTWGQNFQQERMRIDNGRITAKVPFRLEPQSTAPSSPSEGDMYYDNAANQVKVYKGSSWDNLAGASSINDLSDALLENNSLYIGNDPSSTTNSASYNLSLGTGALSNITTADKNTAVGTDALKNHTEGAENVAMGYVALRDNTIGQWNVAVGKGALLSTSSGGSRNIAIGTQALSELNGNVSALNTSVGSNNIAIGHKAGEDKASGGVSLVTGTKNILIGHHVSASSSSAENEIVIGAEALGSGNNTVTLGNSSIANVKTSGSITAGAITIPNTDGSNGQVLSTNGNGTLSWTSPSGSSSNSSGIVERPKVNIGFSSSTTWTCPTGVTKIYIELWGASGGGGGGSGAYTNNGCMVWNGLGWSGSMGGSGGSGGYNSDTVSVVPGQTYSLIVGIGGSGGSGGNCIGSDGSSGGSSQFLSLIAEGGGPGLGVHASLANGSNSGSQFGISGTVQNWFYPSVTSNIPSYIPSTVFHDVPSLAPGGYRGTAGGAGNYSCSCGPGSGAAGTDGFILIHY
jgi:trimeric autotransporter adhesin